MQVTADLGRGDRIQRVVHIPAGILDLYIHRGPSVSDDQIDNLRGERARNIKVWLASWGYIKQEWIADPGDVGILTAESIERLLRDCL